MPPSKHHQSTIALWESNMACRKINHNSLPLIVPWEHLCKVVYRGETEEARGGRRDAPGLRSDQSDAKKQAAWPSGWLITQEKWMIEPWTCRTMNMLDLTMNMLDVAWFNRLNMTNVDSIWFKQIGMNWWIPILCWSHEVVQKWHGAKKQNLWSVAGIYFPSGWVMVWGCCSRGCNGLHLSSFFRIKGRKLDLYLDILDP